MFSADKAVANALYRAGFYKFEEGVCGLPQLEEVLGVVGEKAEGHVNFVADICPSDQDTQRIVAYTTKKVYPNVFSRGLDDNGERRDRFDKAYGLLRKEGFNEGHTFVYTPNADLGVVVSSVNELIQHGFPHIAKRYEYALNVMLAYGVGGYVLNVGWRECASEFERFAQEVTRLDEIV